MTANNVWQTDRLYFRTVEQTDYDWKFKEIDADPANHLVANQRLLAPPRRENPEEWAKKFQHLLDVVICVRTDTAKEQQEEGDAEPKKEVTEEKRIGILCLGNGGYGPSPHNRSAEFGITLTAASQDKGYGTEAVQWALDFAFTIANLHSVHLGCVEFNTRAQKCYEKCGFKLEGRKRHCFWHDRKWWDCLDYGILEEEWEALRKGKE